jgi:hypothetical protein
MQQNAKSRPRAAFAIARGPNYFIAPDEALIAAEAALFADVAASIADDAAVDALIAAEALESVDGVVTTVVEVDGVVVAGVVVVLVVSSFLLQAANETAAARVTIINAVFMFLLGFWIRKSPVTCGNPRSKSPSIRETWKARGLSSA